MKHFLVLITAFFTSNLFAYFPEPGQIARFQPQMRRAKNTPFLARGHINVSDRKLPYELKWFAPGSYQLNVFEVPSSFVSMTSTATGTWSLQRHQGQCSLQAGGSRYVCGTPTFWAYLELMGDVSATPSALVNAGFYSQSDSVYTETNARDPRSVRSAEKRAVLTIGKNGPNPSAVLEIRGPNFRAEEKGPGFPFIHFDQTFLSPLRARFEANASVWDIEATSDLLVRQKYPRFQPILSKRLKLTKGSTFQAEIFREIDEDENVAKNIGKISWQSGATSIDNLRSNLGQSGEAILDLLLLTH